MFTKTLPVAWCKAKVANILNASPRIGFSMPAIIHSDHPTLNDKLDRIASIKNKAEQIMRCDTPQVFGIHGDWGSGKTSYLRQLRFHLDGTTEGVDVSQFNNQLKGNKYNNRVVTVWFDAWRYQHEPAPVVALLQEIRKQFTSWAKLKHKADKLTSVTVQSVLNSFSDITKLLSIENTALNPKSINDIGETWEKEHLEQKLGVDSIQEFLEKATTAVLNEFLSGKTKRLIIIIDDLDRCSPSSAYRLLEGLKVYLGLKNCVFIVGMNQQIVVEAIAANLPQELSQYSNEHKKAAMCIRGEAYLEKICSHIERLQPPADAVGFLTDLVEDPHLKVELVNATVDFDAPFLPPNPRRIKALANTVNHWSGLIKWDTTPLPGIKAKSLLILAYVYQFHGELFQRWQFTPSFYSQLSSWATESWGSEGVKKWPDYLATLKLPHKVTSFDDGTTEVPDVRSTSTYPDPYAADMFWIAPFMRQSDLTEQDITPVLQLIK